MGQVLEQIREYQAKRKELVLQVNELQNQIGNLDMDAQQKWALQPSGVLSIDNLAEFVLRIVEEDQKEDVVKVKEVIEEAQQ